MTTSNRRTVITANTAYDSILLVEGDVVIGAWTATPEDVQNYIDATEANDWEATNPEQAAIEDYGEVVGENGRIDDEARRNFWVGCGVRFTEDQS